MINHISPRLLQFTHLHYYPQTLPELKHSQYFFKQFVFLHMQPPFFCFAAGLNTSGSLSSASSMAIARSSSYSIKFWQSEHKQSLQNFPTLGQQLPKAKHSQYIFKHFVFLHLHLKFPLLSGFDESF